MPFLPVFAGGTTRFQPVYVGDLASLVEIISRNDPTIRSIVDGKTIEAGGPDGENEFNGTWTRTPHHTSADLSQSSFSVHILRDDGDCAQMQEQISARLVFAIRLWDGSRFLHGKTSGKYFHTVPGSSQTTQAGQRRQVTSPLV